MRKLLRVRHLVVGDATWLWSVRRRIDRSRDEDCRTTLWLQREGTRARCGIVFRPGPERVIADGYVESGTVVRLSDRAWLNLYEPGVVHRFLRAAAARGLLPDRPGTVEVDGWPLFDAVTAGRVTPPTAS